MDLYFDSAGNKRVIDFLVKRGIFLGIGEANQNSIDVVTSTVPASPLVLLTQAGIEENSVDHDSVSSPLEKDEEFHLKSRLTLIRNSLQRNQLSKYENKYMYKDTRSCLSDVRPALVHSTDFLCPSLNGVHQADGFDLGSYCKGPMICEDVKESTMSMPHLEDCPSNYSDSEEYFSDQSLSTTSAMSQQNNVWASLPNKDLDSDDGFGCPVSTTGTQDNWNGNLMEKTADNETGDQSKPHSRVSDVGTSSCHKNKTSPWGRVRMVNGLT